jgi:predicted transcriptional regulator
VSPRAACRLETLGFGDVYDYAAGKADWLARGLPTEGEHAQQPRAIQLLVTDVARCELEDRLEQVRARVGATRYGFAFVVSPHGVLLGRVRRSALSSGAADAPAGAVMEPGPSTVRADVSLERLSERMRSDNLTSIPITTPDGVLLGVVRRDDLDSATRSASDQAGAPDQ